MRKLYYTDKHGRRTEFIETTDADFKARAIALLEGSFDNNIGPVYVECVKTGEVVELDYYNLEL